VSSIANARTVSRRFAVDSRDSPSASNPDAPITVVALIRGVAERARFAGAVQRHVAVEFADTASEIIDRITNGRVDAVIVGLHNERGESLAPAAQSIRHRFPFVTVVFYLSLVGADVREALELASSITPSAVIIRDIDDVTSILTQVVLGTRESGAASHIVALVNRVAAPGLNDTLSFMARHTARPLTVADVAQYSGVSRRTLFNRFRRAGLPTVARCIHWLRILHAIARLDSPHVTVEQVADQLEFASSSTLRHLIKRLTSMTASEIRSAGGFWYLLHHAESVLKNASTSRGDERADAFSDDGAHDDEAAHDALHGGVDVGQVQRVVQGADAYGADEGAEYPAASARERRAADDDGGDDVQLIL
jgi:AraC-like DNA-binding protein